jgi:hypothetical protein
MRAGRKVGALQSDLAPLRGCPYRFAILIGAYLVQRWFAGFRRARMRRQRLLGAATLP